MTVAMLESPAAGDNFVLAQLPSDAHCSATAPLKAQGGACSRAGPPERSLGSSGAPLSCVAEPGLYEKLPSLATVRPRARSREQVSQGMRRVNALPRRHHRYTDL